MAEEWGLKIELVNCEQLWERIDNKWLHANSLTRDFGDEDAQYAIVRHHGILLTILKDKLDMDKVGRDLNEFKSQIERAYLLGYRDCYEERGEPGNLASGDDLRDNIDERPSEKMQMTRVPSMACEVCGCLEVYDTPSGRVCKDGHGGIDGKSTGRIKA